MKWGDMEPLPVLVFPYPRLVFVALLVLVVLDSSSSSAFLPHSLSTPCRLALSAGQKGKGWHKASTAVMGWHFSLQKWIPFAFSTFYFLLTFDSHFTPVKRSWLQEILDSFRKIHNRGIVLESIKNFEIFVLRFRKSHFSQARFK